MAARETILIVDDEEPIRTQLRWGLRDEHEVLEAADRREALALVRRNPVDLVLLDLRLPPYSTEITEGREILAALRELRPHLPVIIMTGDQDRETAVEMTAAGAFDFFRKPVNLPELRVVVRRALRIGRLEKEVRRLRSDAASRDGIENLIGRSPAIREMTALVRRVADTNATVLITGESGTGKELVARALHGLGGRRDAPFVPINCAAVPPGLIDDELFGHEKGAFTGAVGRRAGKFEFADGGTLFLDEVGDLPEAVQRRLLRVLQESEITRLGGNRGIPVDVRLVAATHHDLESRIAEGEFRDDLFYRLNVVRIRVPPLRERVGDVALLAEHFLSRSEKRRASGGPERFSAEALAALDTADWPGNVRQLENLATSLAVTCERPVIELSDLPESILGTVKGPRGHASRRDQPSAPPLDLEASEKDLILRALRRSGGNKTQAARLLGISRHVLIGKLRRHGLT